jgi:2-polyprenyl-6-methoxyphenol hydroxylase-like FAD-dependent oxidoreductase
MRGLDTPYPHMTTLPQWRVEEILHGRLSKKVERPVKLLSYVQESDHVVAKLQHGDDKDNVKEVKVKYLIGADGVHSSVRKGTPGWTFDGVVYNLPFALADVTLTGDKLPDFRYFNFIDSKNGALIVIPLLDKSGENAISRVIVSLGTLSETKDKEGKVSQGINKEDPFTLEELQTLIKQRSGYFDMKAENPQWITKFGINERRANGFRRGRCFVMGGKRYMKCNARISISVLN